MKMKNYKAVLKSSLVMLVLFAVAGSGVAQAQQCIARAQKPPRWFAPRALPRLWGTSKCGAGGRMLVKILALNPTFREDIQLTVKLNTNITNEINDERVVTLETEDLTYSSGGIELEGAQLGDEWGLR